MSTESWVVTGPQIIEIDDVAGVRVGLVRGRADVVAHDGPGVRIEVHAVDGRPLEVSLADGELRVGYAFTLRNWEGFLDTVRNVRDRDTADVHIAVPRQVSVKLGTMSAEGLLTGVRAGASVSTVSGSIVTDGTAGLLMVNTVSGDVAIRAHTGDLRLNSVSGELTASGDLGRVSANTVSAPVTLDLTGVQGAVNASTVAGDVTVRLPAERGVTVSARSVSGRVVIDGHEHKGKGQGPGQVSVELQTGDGACAITAKTVSGHLTVLRGVADHASPSDTAGAGGLL
ncbi:DUF4097 family beta strand repeat-containing protein [Pengzhenrongella sicca]|uniref:DUF4097 family beta strand repeat protein n=1 Tax=Pengzhenrongella sicca TaxID=2819238 RepID=A0A8A4ZFX3_9MICO|nr:DUF4097 family beta strand repeat-containing protein [Pengzhenrongella sicca]QTE30301.1 DUF4097 family beta strand repeat protein [Pengzhenrongella sicca]